MLAAALLSFSSCGNEKGKTDEGINQASDSEEVIKPPAMDIHSAAFMGDLDAVKQHVNAGSDLNQKDAYGSTPLTIAVTFGKTEVAIALIEGGADLNGINNDGSTPLHTAAFFCRIEIVEALLAKSADKSIKNNFGSTAYESVAGPFEPVKGIYDQISKELGPLGLKLDYDYLETTRPKIAALLK